MDASPASPPPFDGDPAWRMSSVLADGTRVELRPIFPEDRDELRRAYRETSPNTRYLRFLGVMGDLSDAMLDYLVDVDQKDHIAIVATVTSDDLKRERGIGVARFIRVVGEPEVAEAAVTVVDAMQRKGVGMLLVRELVRSAIAHGIRRLRADVLADNATMRAILESAGARCHTRAGESAGTIGYEVDLESDPPRELHPRLLAILRGAAETLAMTIKRLLPPEGLGVRSPPRPTAAPVEVLEEADSDAAAATHEGEADGGEPER